MNGTPLMIASFPRAILHVDGDAFFTSVEQSLVPSLKGKPVVTGRERGIIACASYEAKALGIKRGISLGEARKLCPSLVVLPSDYETYSLYSKRMFNIIRKYTPAVEEYSIDEAFADITGLRRLFRCSYEEIALKISDEIKSELNLTVSTGLSLSKGLAKLCSKFRKPSGFTAVPGKHIHVLLQKTPLDKVWGIGPAGAELLRKHGLRTAYDFVDRPCAWVETFLHKPGRELWNELRGNSVWKITAHEKTSYASIVKSKTFTPPSGNREFVYARLIRNMESAFMKARRYRLRPRVIGVVLRHDDFRHDGLEAKLNRPTSSALEAVPMARKLFDRIFLEKSRYRATMIMLGELEDDNVEQYELFEDRVRIESLETISGAIDEINGRYGKHALCSATSLFMQGRPRDDRAVAPPRRRITLKGESARRRLGIPRMDINV